MLLCWTNSSNCHQLRPTKALLSLALKFTVPLSSLAPTSNTKVVLPTWCPNYDNWTISVKGGAGTKAKELVLDTFGLDSRHVLQCRHAMAPQDTLLGELHIIFLGRTLAY